MPRHTNHSFSRRLTWLNMLVSGCALLLASLTFGAYDLFTFRDTMVKNLSTQAQIVAANSAAAILFNDPTAAGETMTALKASPNVVFAEIYTTDGHPFASYWRDGVAQTRAVPRATGGALESTSIDRSGIDVTRAIVSDGKSIGVVHIRSDVRALYDELRRNAMIAGAVLLMSLAAALLISRLAQRTISRPLADVAAVARQVSQEKDFSARAPMAQRTHELASLVDSFNTMLAEIQQRDRSLREAQAELEARVRQRTEELRATNSELEAFSYSVSHDLRAPLRHIAGFATMLEQHVSDGLDEQGRRYLKTIRDAAGRMSTLIDDLLAFSRMGRASLTKQRVDLSALVDDVRAELSADLNGRRVAWTVHPLPPVDADPALLRPVLVNLLSNALKYTHTRDEAQIEIGADGRTSGELVVFVRDNGVGFDMAYAHKLFGVFQRLHRADEFSGTGIGLANVRRIVQRHGGRTWADAAVDRGATFYFSLPVSAATEGASA